MSRPRLLDLFSGAGGCSVGYHRAGFDVTGVDIAPQPNYPFEFHQGDALEFLAQHGHEFDAIHASPPCQGYLNLAAVNKALGRTTTHSLLIGATRDLLLDLDVPYVIENVADAKPELIDPVRVCGTSFALPIRRHRLFESDVFLLGNGGCRCAEYRRRGIGVGGVYGGGSVDRTHAKEVRRGGYTPAKEVRAALIGTDWMTLHGLSQAIPPAYTEHIGEQLMAHLEAEAAA